MKGGTRKTWRQRLAWLLSTAMLLTLLPAVPAAYAEEATATVEGEDVTPTYGESVELIAHVTSDGITSATDGIVTFKVGEQTLGTPVAPIEGTATVTITTVTDGYKKIFGNGSTGKVSVEYTAPEASASVTGEINVTVIKKELTLTFTPVDREYNGEAAVTGNLEGFESQLVFDTDNVTATAKATMDDADARNGKPVTVTVTLGGADKDFYTVKEITGVTVDITKATLTEEQVTAPTAKTELKYTGSPQNLLATEGIVPDGCTMKYAVKEGSAGMPSDGDWKDGISEITATAVGSYNVYWKVEGGTNYNEYTPGSGSPISVTIDKADPGVNPPTGKSDLSYTGEAQELIKDKGSTDDGTIQYYVGDDKPSADSGWETDTSRITGTNAGTYKVWYYVDGDENHEDSEAQSITVTIAKATVSVEEVSQTIPYDTNSHTVGSVTVNTNDAPELSQGSDYSVLYTTQSSGSSTGGTENKTDAGAYDV